MTKDTKDTEKNSTEPRRSETLDQASSKQREAKARFRAGLKPGGFKGVQVVLFPNQPRPNTEKVD